VRQDATDGVHMLRNMKTGTKIMAGFALALLITMIVGVAGFVSASRVSVRLNEVANEKFPSALLLADIVGAETRVARGLNALMLRRMTDAEMRRSVYADIEKGQKDIESAMSAYEALPQSEQALRLWSRVRDPYRSWDAASRAALDLIRQRDQLFGSGRYSANSQEVEALDARIWDAYLAARQKYGPLGDAVQAVVDQTRKDVEASKKSGQDAASSAGTAIVAFIVLGAALMAALGALLSRSVSRVIRSLLAETSKLNVAVQQGRLDVRGDVAAVSPEFQPVVGGINKAMDSFTEPIKVTAEYVELIATGEIPPEITDSYQGDFDTIKAGLNGLIQVLNMRNEDVRRLIDSAVAGRLHERADTSKYKGSNGRLLAGMNAILDAVLAPIQEASQVLDRLAQRDLRARMNGSYQGDHGKIKDGVNATAQALHDSIVQVAQVVEQVASASNQIASSAHAVANGASEQASVLEETAAGLESMATITQQATESAQQANALAKQAREAATEGGAATGQMTSAMTKIKASAEGTSQIIKDINEIAFQTNLLALNAAVEAARAGEAGRGFAVVAEEVRSLALRSKDAANKTEELIRQSVKEAGEGEVTARQVAEQLSAIVASIGKVTDIVAEIAASSKEQAAGIDQVNKAVADVDKVTQQNAASSEESSSAAAELSGQARQLEEMVGTFQLERGAAAPGKKSTVQRSKGRSGGKGGVSAQNGIPLEPGDVIPMEGELVPGEF
jgi:methyl-accepting chemotaxis protein